MASVLAKTWLPEDDRRLGDIEAVPALPALRARGADEREREPGADEARPA